MGFIGNKEKNFRKYLENHFGIVLHQSIAIFYQDGVRIGNREITKSDIDGELGYAACDAGFNPTNSLIQNFGHLARKNFIQVNAEEGKQFASGKPLSVDLGVKNKYIIVKYQQHIVGLGQYDSKKKKIINKIPQKRRREIINSI
ncbi:hypothetical protein HY988_05725 [Candidatus Micrarchaeota archaeon]|nr:hypothetical protein [Candidatus Micrarchaeota archaeon]